MVLRIVSCSVLVINIFTSTREKLLEVSVPRDMMGKTATAAILHETSIAIRGGNAPD